MRFWKNHRLLAVCLLLSLVLLVALVALQLRDSPVLQLEAKWLLVAGVPMLVALIVGGYVTNFKGFGFELEAKLRSPVSTLNLTARDAIAGLPGDEKQSVARLPNFTEKQRASTKRLSFISGRQDYYGVSAVIRYLEAFPNLEYVEVKRESRAFVCLIPVEEFQRESNEPHRRRFDKHEVNRFLEALAASRVLAAYSHNCVSLTVRQDDGLISTLRKLRDANRAQAAVVNSDDHFIGLTSVRDIEHRIAEDVLALQKV